MVTGKTAEAVWLPVRGLGEKGRCKLVKWLPYCAEPPCAKEGCLCRVLTLNSAYTPVVFADPKVWQGNEDEEHKCRKLQVKTAWFCYSAKGSRVSIRRLYWKCSHRKWFLGLKDERGHRAGRLLYRLTDGGVISISRKVKEDGNRWDR